MAEDEPNPPAATIDLAFTYRYRHGLGALSHYFDGLERGEAHATRCASCGRTWFPPRLVCACGSDKTQWARLAGTGEVRAVTEGTMAPPLDAPRPSGCFALIAMDGADNLAIGRISETGPVVRGSWVRLVADPHHRAHPAQAAAFVLL